MNVLVIEPYTEPYAKEIHGLRDMQALVGGTSTASYPFKEPVAIVSNDDSIGMGMEFNHSIEGGCGGVFGTFFVCGMGEEDFTSLTSEQIKKYTERFKKAEILIGVNGQTPITIKVDATRKNPPDQPKHPRKPPAR